MIANKYLFLPKFNKKPIFNKIKLLNNKKNLLSSSFITSKNNIKIKSRTQRLKPSSLKRQKPLLLTVKLKQIWVRQKIKQISKIRNKIILPLSFENIKGLITQLVKLFNKDWKKAKNLGIF